MQFADTQCANGATINSQSGLSNISKTVLALNVVNHQTEDETVKLNETEDALPSTRRACQKNGEDTTLVNGGMVSVVVSQTPNQQNGATASRFEQQVNGCHAMQRAVMTDGRESYVNETRLQPRFRTMTSYNVTSSDVTSGSGPRRPLSVDVTPMTSRLSVMAVQVGQSAGPGVDRSRENLWTDSARAAIIPRKTTSSRGVSTSAPQDETSRSAGHRRPTAPVGGSTSHTTHSADHSVRSQPEPLDIVVTKTGLALGFSIDGGKDSVFGDRPITVKKVYRGKRSLL